MIEKIQIYISIIAAVAISIASIINGATLYEMALWLIIVIVLFYFLGLIVKSYLVKNVFPPEIEAENPDGSPENDGTLTDDTEIDGTAEIADSDNSRS